MSVWHVESNSSEFPILVHTLAVWEWQFWTSGSKWVHGHASARYLLKRWWVYRPSESHDMLSQVLVLFGFSDQKVFFWTFFWVNWELISRKCWEKWQCYQRTDRSLEGGKSRLWNRKALLFLCRAVHLFHLNFWIYLIHFDMNNFFSLAFCLGHFICCKSFNMLRIKIVIHL